MRERSKDKLQAPEPRARVGTKERNTRDQLLLLFVMCYICHTELSHAKETAADGAQSIIRDDQHDDDIS